MTKNKHIHIILPILIAFCLFSCENELDLEIPDHESKLVVEGWIETNSTAKVLLSLSAPYFTKIDSSNLRDYSVTTAKVSLRNKSTGEVLTLKPNEVFFPPYYYFGTEIVGLENENYELEINYKEKTYISSTSIPKMVPLDSAWFMLNSNSDTSGQVFIRIIDAPNENNFFRVFTKQKGKDQHYKATFTSTFSDELFTNDTITLALLNGSNNALEVEQNRYYHSNDTIIVKFCTINEEHFTYWKDIQTHIINSANPLSVTHSDISSNIENGYGYWGGYAVWYDTIYPNKNPSWIAP